MIDPNNLFFYFQLIVGSNSINSFIENKIGRASKDYFNVVLLNVNGIVRKIYLIVVSMFWLFRRLISNRIFLTSASNSKDIGISDMTVRAKRGAAV